MTTALFIIGTTVWLLWQDVRLRRARAELARERAARRDAVEAAWAEGFGLGASACPLSGAGALAPGSGREAPQRDRVPGGVR